MPLPLLAMLAIQSAPAIIGSIFGKHGSSGGVPDWLQPYLDDYMKNVVGGYDSMIEDANQRDPVRKALRQEALAATGGGKFAAQGYGPIAGHALEQLRAKQATGAKALDRSTSMNFAAAGLNSGLLQAVKAQQQTEQEQSNELANSSAVSNIALGSIDRSQAATQAQNDFLLRLQNAKGDAYGNVLRTVAGVGAQPSAPSMASRILGGVASAAPPILSGLGNTGGGSTTPTSAPPPQTFNGTIGGSYQNVGYEHGTTPPFVAPTTIPTTQFNSTVPNDYDDLLKYYKPRKK